jgi:ArsR family transcriptional regulator
MKKDQLSPVRVRRFADMFSAMGAEPRLKIVRLLLSAHPAGLTVGDIQSALDIPNSTLSHHLDRLKQEDLVKVRREGTFLWYAANSKALEQLLTFFYTECCTRNQALPPEKILSASA